ncbi:MAG: LysM peptidoglycan-binding domain-containing protein [Bacteroidaceae bacterium]|nr:LysM peptidoglycan-binding domain-containing protein [Bacteroidaceae bacterium]
MFIKISLGMKSVSFFVGVFLLLVGMSSCSHRLTDFTVISTRNVPLGNQVASLQKADQRVKGVDRSHVILFLPIGTPNMKEAIDRAIDKYPGAIGLVDGVVKSKGWSILLYGQNSFVVEGTPLYEADVKKQDVPVNNGQSEETMLFFHEVKEGETLSAIATSYNVTIADIIKWNKLSSADVVKGTKLKILVK